MEKLLHSTNPAPKAKPPKFRVFAKMRYLDAIMRAESENRVVAPNMTVASLTNSEWQKVSKVAEGAYPCNTGTMVAYAEPGIQMIKSRIYSPDTKSLAYRDENGIWRVFFVPEQLREEKDVLLVSEHPDSRIFLDAGKEVVHAARIFPIFNFPKKNGPYALDAEFGIPRGYAHTHNVPLGYLHRAEGAMVTQVSRKALNKDGEDCRSHVFLDTPPSPPLPAIIELQ
jgi:hypothetical protein